MKLTLSAGVFLLIAVLFPGPGFASEPTIAPEIGQIIAEEGIEAANMRFSEMINDPSLNVTMEIQGLTTLATAYIQANNIEAATAVGEMTQKLTMAMMSGISMQQQPGMATQMEAYKQAEEAAAAQEAAEKKEQLKLEQRRLVQERGKSRSDLDRFKGLYAPEDGDPNKALFVTTSCDGYLVTGPMWADVGPWWMRSAADHVFTYSDSWTDLSMEFTSGPGGKITGLKHDVDGLDSPADRTGDLPADWPACQERPKR